MTVLTSFIYFYVMPVFTFSSEEAVFNGLRITTLAWIHLAALLYILGAAAAFFLNYRTLAVNPAISFSQKKSTTLHGILFLWLLASIGVFFQYRTGVLGFFPSEGYQAPQTDIAANFSFVSQAYNLMVPLTLVTLVRNRFRLSSLIVLALVILIFLQVGFRFRIMVLLASAISAYALMKNLKVGVIATVGGAIAGIGLVNLIGLLRVHYRGLQLSNLEGESFSSVFAAFNGEIGPVFALGYTAEHPPDAWITVDPWLIAVMRLVPTFIWPDKPYPQYISYFLSEIHDPNALMTGMAPPQQAEMLLQFGWGGLPVLAFMYFCVACLLLRQVLKLSFETRVAGASMIPTFFGYYMQSRGYFFQILVDGLFVFGSLFVMEFLGGRRPTRSTRNSLQAGARGSWQRHSGGPP